MTYSDYLTHAFEQFQQAHEKWMRTNRINDWENWVYNSEAGVLTFFTGEEKIYFRYVPVGSYSDKTDSWLWAWQNQYSVHPQKKLTYELRTFGEKHGYDLLSEGYHTDEEEQGWDFIAIAHYRLGGLGGYRIPTDHLRLYALITEALDKEKAEWLLANPQPKTIECGEHGMSRHAFVCGHLSKEHSVGFYESRETHMGMVLEGENDDFEAWCDACEKVRAKEGEWNETSQACLDMKLVCENCYFEYKATGIRTAENSGTVTSSSVWKKLGKLFR